MIGISEHYLKKKKKTKRRRNKKQMKKKITLILMVLLIVNIFSAFALTEKERNDINEFINTVEDNKDRFEILLAFLDAKQYDLSKETEIKENVEDKAVQLEILLSPYDINGLNAKKVDKEILKKIEITHLKDFAKKPTDLGNFWPIAIVLISLIVVIYVLELYREEKIKK